MTLAEYKTQNLGRSIDLDKYPKEQPYQCVDMVSDYAVRVCGAGRFTGNARDMAGQTQGGKFRWVTSGTPSVGAVYVYGPTWGGGFGHVGVILGYTTSTVTLLQQNSPSPFVTVATYPRTGGLGWLIPIVDVNVAPAPASDFKVRVVVDTLTCRAGAGTSYAGGRANRHYFPDGNLHRGDEIHVVRTVKGGTYSLNGTSDQWHVTDAGNYVAVLGTVRI